MWIAPKGRCNQACLVSGERDPRQEVRSHLLAAFPLDLGERVERAVLALPVPFYPCSSDDIGSITWCGRVLRIPHRVYFAGHPPIADTVMAAILTRHHDGHVREAAVRVALQEPQPWVVPWVMQLLGEYVIEIVEVVEAHQERLLREDARAFVRANPAFVALTQQRATSYRNAYHHHCYPRRSDSPASRLLAAMRHASDSPIDEPMLVGRGRDGDGAGQG